MREKLLPRVIDRSIRMTLISAEQMWENMKVTRSVVKLERYCIHNAGNFEKKLICVLQNIGPLSNQYYSCLPAACLTSVY